LPAAIDAALAFAQQISEGGRSGRDARAEGNSMRVDSACIAALSDRL